jgi:1,6-anhydro-N-acetylmuramate kinase
MGHSRIDTTQVYTDEIELDELAEALARALAARDTQASPDVATLEAEVATALQWLEWRRRESNPPKIPAVTGVVAPRNRARARFQSSEQCAT